MLYTCLPIFSLGLVCGRNLIAANLAVVRLATEQMVRTNPGAVAFEQLHASDYLIYAYLQRGEDARALEIIKEMTSVQSMDDPNFAAAHALVTGPARYAVERRDWYAASALQLPTVVLRWEDYPYAKANTYYAKALGNARLGNIEQTQDALHELADLQVVLSDKPPRGPYDWAGRTRSDALSCDRLARFC